MFKTNLSAFQGHMNHAMKLAKQKGETTIPTTLVEREEMVEANLKWAEEKFKTAKMLILLELHIDN